MKLLKCRSRPISRLIHFIGNLLFSVTIKFLMNPVFFINTLYSGHHTRAIFLKSDFFVQTALHLISVSRLPYIGYE